MRKATLIGFLSVAALMTPDAIHQIPKEPYPYSRFKANKEKKRKRKIQRQGRRAGRK